VIALSLRHFFPEQWDGREGKFTVAQHIADVIAFIEALQAGPVNLFGHSRGGHIAFRVAQRHPDLLHKLILAEPGGELDASLARPEYLSSLSPVGRVAGASEMIAAGDFDGGLRFIVDGNGGEGTWEWLAAAAKQEYRDNAKTLLGQINEQRQPFSRADAEAISVPTLFILGEKTPGPLPVVLRALAATVRGSETAVIANASHHMIRQEPVGTCAAVLEFLAGN
jgi:pimeloyl-ACP methyl ester carboxylesterase